MSRITPASVPGSNGRAVSGRPEDVRAPGDLGATEDALTPDGRSTRWADHRVARRTELVHAARRAVHRHGPDVSMDEIATTAGTSKSIVYRYFVDKPGLQRAVGEAVVDQMHTAMDEAARLAETPREALRGVIDVYLEMAEASPNVYWFVTRPVSEDASVPLGHFLDQVAGLIARPFARVAAAEGQPGFADVWASGAVGFVRGVGEWWLQHRGDPEAPSREVLTDRVTSWLWTGPVSGLTRSRPDAVAADLTQNELTQNELTQNDLTKNDLSNPGTSG